MKRVDISGMSGPYENACQTMLTHFLEWAKDKTFEDLFPKSADEKITFDKQAEKELMNLVDDIAPSGAMWGATLSHFAFIKKNGYDKWLEDGGKKNGLIDWNPEDRIHFDSPQEAFESGKKIGERMRKQ